jgi:hypothetical protein
MAERKTVGEQPLSLVFGVIAWMDGASNGAGRCPCQVGHCGVLPMRLVTKFVYPRVYRHEKSFQWVNGDTKLMSPSLDCLPFPTFSPFGACRVPFTNSDHILFLETNCSSYGVFARIPNVAYFFTV